MNLVVEDEYINSVSQYVGDMLEGLSYILTRYKRAMNDVIEEGFMEGETSDALKTFLDQFKANDNNTNLDLKVASTGTHTCCYNFIEEIDVADKDLY